MMGYISKEIREILFGKIDFWKEIVEENPKVKKLEISGRKLVNQIENLHKFYMLKMRPSE